MSFHRRVSVSAPDQLASANNPNGQRQPIPWVARLAIRTGALSSLSQMILDRLLSQIFAQPVQKNAFFRMVI
jgi:hypothetical protein